MPEPGSITKWIWKLKESDQEAIQRLWEVYYSRLVILASKRLRGTPRGAADEEDVAACAFETFCREAGEGRFPHLNDRDDLWHLLVVITARKAITLARHETRDKRGGGRVLHLSALDNDKDVEDFFVELVSREPDPAFAAQLAEESRNMFECLEDEMLCKIATWKLEGRTNAEIATLLGRSQRTVDRKLVLIRDIWQEHVSK